MELTKFRITNFRSINDSGEIAIDKITSLVGRNESGKSNLILALATLKPPAGRAALSAIKDFPRGRRLEECKADTPVVSSTWKLSKSESAELARLLPGSPRLSEVEIGRG
ncbi:AAA family ATPase [Bradyrhizobium sp. Ec3.3]|uniref:AAA family ATPase n=1 Tax=Bradyrhizobium sp. Ec3.3 TaxID=189753 RepID=UPI0018DC1D3A|nr:AAA family ATPase [Bradyrhizobium sp. Ec3.3]